MVTRSAQEPTEATQAGLMSAWGAVGISSLQAGEDVNLFALLEQICAGTEADPVKRVEELRKKRDALDAEIARVLAGDVPLLDDTAVKDRFLQFEQLARELLADFREVEHNFRQLDRTTTYLYLAVADAVDNLRNYFEDASRRLLDLFDKLIAPDTLSVGLRRELLRVLDTRSDDFDPRGLRALVESTLARLPWPQLHIEPPDPAQALAGFSGELRDSSRMSALRERLAQVVNELQKTLAQRLDKAVQQVCDRLDTLAQELQAALTQSLAADLERLRAALADKARQVERLQALVKLVEAEKQAISTQHAHTTAVA